MFLKNKINSSVQDLTIFFLFLIRIINKTNQPHNVYHKNINTGVLFLCVPNILFYTPKLNYW